MGLRVRARNREPEAGPAAGVAVGETLEQPLAQLVRHAAALVLDAHAQLPVALGGGEPDRRRAVLGGIEEDVREHPLEHERIRDRCEVARDVEPDRRLRRQRVGHDLLEDAAQDERTGRDHDRLRVEAREVEQLLEQPPQPVGLVVRDLEQLLTSPLREVRARAEGGEGAVHRRGRRAQLV